ncbi:hypothetical protein A2U01_0066972, partial [Trifolium medium]|nr:hypothetical protein [Trifolium medium]
VGSGKKGGLRRLDVILERVVDWWSVSKAEIPSIVWYFVTKRRGY